MNRRADGYPRGTLHLLVLGLEGVALNSTMFFESGIYGKRSAPSVCWREMQRKKGRAKIIGSTQSCVHERISHLSVC